METMSSVMGWECHNNWPVNYFFFLKLVSNIILQPPFTFAVPRQNFGEKNLTTVDFFYVRPSEKYP